MSGFLLLFRGRPSANKGNQPGQCRLILAFNWESVPGRKLPLTRVCSGESGGTSGAIILAKPDWTGGKPGHRRVIEEVH